MSVLLVALGGALGAVARFGVAALLQRGGGAFPIGTLTVNLVGSFLLALVAHATTRGLLGAELRLFLATGVLGGFTTYSSFNQETLQLLAGSAPWLGVANMAATLLGCLVAGLAGLILARALLGA